MLLSGHLGQIHDTKIIVSEAAVNPVVKFTKKQKRKLTNTRWTKRYFKNHSHIEMQPGQFYSKVQQTLYVHPSVFARLQGGISLRNKISEGFHGHPSFPKHFNDPGMFK